MIGRQITTDSVHTGFIVTGGQDAKVLVHDLDADGMLHDFHILAIKHMHIGYNFIANLNSFSRTIISLTFVIGFEHQKQLILFF